MIPCLLFLLSSSSLAVADGGDWFYGRDKPDRWSTGEVWPLPQSISYGDAIRVSPGRISVTPIDDCDVVSDNVERYTSRLFFPFPVDADASAAPFTLSVVITNNCTSLHPQLNMDERYTLNVTSTRATLTSNEVWGFVRGIETFSQLIYYNESSNAYFLRTASIVDFPRFSVRGTLIDPARHFLSVKTTKRHLDLMAANKMNLLHWHLVDSEGFTYQSAAFPELHSKGAYSKRHFYTRDNIKDIIDYARKRGIRVIPEFDTPGHTAAWRGREGFLTDCFDSDNKPTLQNLLDPTNEDNFVFLTSFFEEIASTFPDSWLHLGGDEVSGFVTQCWKRNPKILAWMAANGKGNDTRALENYYFDRLQGIMANLNIHKQNIFWQEVFDRNKPAASSIIHLWKGDTFQELRDEIASAVSKNHSVIVSSCWYLNFIKYGADWKYFIDGYAETKSRFYYCDPQDFAGTEKEKEAVLGGMAAFWGEMVDNTNLEPLYWPRASAAAERLWSDASQTKEAEAAWPRLHEFRCRLVARGYRVSPNNFPDYCPFEFDSLDDSPSSSSTPSPSSPTTPQATTQSSSSLHSLLFISLISLLLLQRN